VRPSEIRRRKKGKKRAHHFGEDISRWSVVYEDEVAHSGGQPAGDGRAPAPEKLERPSVNAPPGAGGGSLSEPDPRGRGAGGGAGMVHRLGTKETSRAPIVAKKPTGAQPDFWSAGRRRPAVVPPAKRGALGDLGVSLRPTLLTIDKRICPATRETGKKKKSAWQSFKKGRPARDRPHSLARFDWGGKTSSWPIFFFLHSGRTTKIRVIFSVSIGHFFLVRVVLGGGEVGGTFCLFGLFFFI